jgi:threonine synthase
MIHELWNGNGRDVAELLTRFRAERRVRLPADKLKRLRALFAAGRASDEETIATIARIHRATGELLDPHTAVGVHVTEQIPAKRGVARVTLACAHPAKFPDAVERATGIRPALPPRLADLHARPERVSVLPNDVQVLRAFIAERTRTR